MASPPTVTFVIEDDDGNRADVQLSGPGGASRLVIGEPDCQSGIWRAEPPLPDHLKFYVVVGEPGRCDLTLGDHVGEVGHMRLTNDRFVGVVADSRSADAAFAEMVRNDLEKAVNTPGADPFTWQTAATGFLFFLDLAVMLTDTLPTDG